MELSLNANGTTDWILIEVKQTLNKDNQTTTIKREWSFSPNCCRHCAPHQEILTDVLSEDWRRFAKVLLFSVSSVNILIRRAQIESFFSSVSWIFFYYMLHTTKCWAPLNGTRLFASKELNESFAHIERKSRSWIKKQCTSLFAEIQSLNKMKCINVVHSGRSQSVIRHILWNLRSRCHS